MVCFAFEVAHKKCERKCEQTLAVPSHPPLRGRLRVKRIGIYTYRTAVQAKARLLQSVNEELRLSGVVALGEKCALK